MTLKLTIEEAKLAVKIIDAQLNYLDTLKTFYKDSENKPKELNTELNECERLNSIKGKINKALEGIEVEIEIDG